MGLFDFFRKPKATAAAGAQIPDEQQAGKPAGQSAEPVVARSEAALLEQFRQEVEIPSLLMGLRGERAEGALLQLRTLLAPRGEIPVILGNREELDRVMEVVEDQGEGDLCFPALDPEQWLAARNKEIREFQEEGWWGEQSEIHEIIADPSLTLQAPFDLKARPKPEVFIGSLPVTEHWMVPLYLQYGDWNECPPSEVHAVMARRWEEKFGAQIAAVTPDTIEFTVKRPPATEDEAMELAWEMYYYCNDIVDQGLGSVATLAEALRCSTRWFFWWD